MKKELPWSERVNAISINPDMASRHDIAQMAAELSEYAMIEAKMELAKKAFAICVQELCDSSDAGCPACVYYLDGYASEYGCTKPEGKQCIDGISAWALRMALQK